ncbi:unnamed protein product [Parascedosporium putredinis]|uniref:Integral membrane bound transporter domain-containing protein n=1 Tax=Parascedosporium putredinis TaxID=1442378 RepID=A0A9P1GXV0_9PEZI|nr:unnamed protein product [Parascedosporium putredinis]CAI7990077.1 unnamed protein product [Parascedosporium putredinis]
MTSDTPAVTSPADATKFNPPLLPVSNNHTRTNSFHSVFTTESVPLRRRFEALVYNVVSLGALLWAWLRSPNGKAVLKCSLAYVLGTTATFWEPFADFLGRLDGKHIVATITVYFHPARTVGSMLEAILISIAAVLFAQVVSFASMATSLILSTKLGMVALARFVVLIVFIGGGLGFEEVVYGGQFSTAKNEQVLKMLLLGITITSAVNMLVWRSSARRGLRRAMSTGVVSLGEQIAAITRGFLNGSEEELHSTGYANTLAQLTSSHDTISSTLRESKFEYYFLGREKQYFAAKAIVASIDKLSQAVGGLRSACDAQFVLLKESNADPPNRALSPISSAARRPTITRAVSSFLRQTRENMASLDSISETVEIDDELVMSPEPVYADSVSVTGFRILVNVNFKSSLAEALSLYDQARTSSLQDLYDSIELEKARSEDVQADIEEVAAACSHFSYSLQSVAHEISAYLDAIDDFKFVVDANFRSWNWLRFWRYVWPSRKGDAIAMDDIEGDSLLEPHRRVVRPLRKSAMPQGIPDELLRRRDNYNWDAAGDVSEWARKVAKTWMGLLRWLTRDDILFGIKVGIGAIAWAAFAFIPTTRPTYKQWRGEWGLLSYMIVIATTVGASNTTSLARFRGTIIGAICALTGWIPVQLYLVFETKSGQLARMTLLTWNVSVLYAFSLARELYDDDQDDLDEDSRPLIFDICFHRFIAVTLGIVWGLIVCRIIWPLSGRKKFREGVSVLYLQLGLIWKRGPLAVLLRGGDNPTGYLRTAQKLDGLRNAAQSEFSLRGPFPKDPYARIMQSTNRILDGFHAMNLATMRRAHLSPGERALLRFTAPERAILCDRICHVCQVIASSVMLEYPLTDAIPSIIGVKDRLLSKMHQIRKQQAEMIEREQDARLNPDGGDLGLSHGTSTAVDIGTPGPPSPATTTPTPWRRRISSPYAERSTSRGRSGASYGASVREGMGFTFDSTVDASDLAIVKERDFSLLYIYTLLTSQVADELGKVLKEVEGLFGVLSEEALLLQ